ncbi:MAG: UDP-3-O-acyl-N-acetylglucosamine deacetylase [Bacteroidales bacterium]|nr:UDP-3-O-acyl-N-acetylglucosamine deacetylase [Bacteroidales bacterium]
MNQRTLSKEYAFEGKGLHTGKHSRVLLRPAPADTGIVFVRTDLGGVQVRAEAANVVSTRRSTMLGSGCAKVGTVEHVLSALTGLGVDNAYIDIDRAEMPILDGSAAPYVAAIAPDGLTEQDAPRVWVEVPGEILVRREKSGAWIKITPSDEPSVELTIDFPSKVLVKQTVCCDATVDYASQIAPCRTFCFLHEVLPLLCLGLARGGDLGNAIVIVEKPMKRWQARLMSKAIGKPLPEKLSAGFLCNPDLRFPDECARHKLLDLLGDLRLCGGFLKARIEAYKPGHALNTRAAKEIFCKL